MQVLTTCCRSAVKFAYPDTARDRDHTPMGDMTKISVSNLGKTHLGRIRELFFQPFSAGRASNTAATRAGTCWGSIILAPSASEARREIGMIASAGEETGVLVT